MGTFGIYTNRLGVIKERKETRTFYQAIVTGLTSQDFQVSQSLYRSEEEAKRILGYRYVRLLTDRPIEVPYTETYVEY